MPPNEPTENSSTALDAGRPYVAPVRFAIRSGGCVLLMESSEVIAVEARGRHVLVRTSSRSQSAHESVSTLDEKLKPYGFVRIHRSTIVNGALVEEIQILKSGEMRVRVKGTDKEYCVSRRYKSEVSRFAPTWV